MTTTDTTAQVAGWALGTVPDDPFAALPDNGEDVDLLGLDQPTIPDPADVAHADKSAQAVADGAVVPLAGALYTVVSSNGSRTYVVNVVTGSCTCPAGQHGRRCYHLGAARLVADRYLGDHRSLVARHGRHAGLHPSILAEAKAKGTEDEDEGSTADEDDPHDNRGTEPYRHDDY